MVHLFQFMQEGNGHAPLLGERGLVDAVQSPLDEKPAYGWRFAAWNKCGLD